MRSISTRSTALRLLAALTVMVGLLAGCGNDDAGTDDLPTDETLPDGWDLHTDDESGLSFALPGEPEIATQPLTIPDGPSVVLRMYFVERGDWAVIVGLNEVPDSGFDLVGAVRGAVGSVGGTIVDSSPATLGDHTARDAEVRFETDGGGADGLFFLRVMVVDGTTIQFQTIGSVDDRDAMLADHEVLRSVVVP